MVSVPRFLMTYHELPVKVQPFRVAVAPGGQIRVTMAGELVAVHDASQGTGRINYTEGHYGEAIGGKARFADADIRAAARENLELLDRLGGGGDE